MSSGQTLKLTAIAVAVVTGLSMATAQAKPQQVPASPKLLKVMSSDRALTVNTNVPRSTTPILNFEYSIDGGTSWTPESPAVTTGPILIAGLTNGQIYQVAIRAVNVSGTGASSGIKSASPATVPDAPHIDLIKGTGMWFHVYFTAGASDGFARISQWQFDIDETGRWMHWGKGASSPQVVMMPWAKLGDSHIIRVRAINAVGASSVSNLVTVTMFKTGLHIFQ
jgi:hypothetical protein